MTVTTLKPASAFLPPAQVLPAAKTGSRILNAADAAAAVRQGIVRAARDCEEWGRFWPNERGCENLLQVRAAEEIHASLRMRNLGWLTLEEPMANVSYAGTRKRGPRYRAMTDQQRVDIAIWTKAEEIYALIEIKRAERDRDWIGDLNKLGRLLATYGRREGCHLRYGILGVYMTCASGGDTLDERKKTLKELAGKVARKFDLIADVRLDDSRHRWPSKLPDDWTCGAASVVFRGVC